MKPAGLTRKILFSGVPPSFLDILSSLKEGEDVKMGCGLRCWRWLADKTDSGQRVSEPVLIHRQRITVIKLRMQQFDHLRIDAPQSTQLINS